ncbi:MAG: hypothetical protein WCR69_00585 [Sulfuricurvum sp.]|jgi:hypothetical protein
MEVQSYTYLSPYSSPVQIGRPDPTAKKEDPTMELEGSKPVKEAPKTMQSPKDIPAPFDIHA